MEIQITGKVAIAILTFHSKWEACNKLFGRKRQFSFQLLPQLKGEHPPSSRYDNEDTPCITAHPRLLVEWTNLTPSPTGSELDSQTPSARYMAPRIGLFLHTVIGTAQMLLRQDAQLKLEPPCIITSTVITFEGKHITNFWVPNRMLTTLYSTWPKHTITDQTSGRTIDAPHSYSFLPRASLPRQHHR